MQNLMEELRRRNLFRVAVACLLGCWLLLQVAEVLAGVLGLADRSLTLAEYLVALGLPIALLFSWVYQVTPRGLKRRKEQAGDATARRLSNRRLNLAIAGMMVLAVPLFAVQLISSGGIGALILPESASTIQSRVDASGLALPEYESVAVLPFASLGADPHDGYFSDGISEELLNLLSGVRGLRVPSRTSSFAFKDQPVDRAVIAGALGVNHVLEGSVRRAGDRIRVTAQLVDARTDTPVWSETYDRQMSDIFQIQDEIAGRIVAALRSSLGDRGLLPERRPPTDNMAAYDLYLRGLALFRQRGDEAGVPEAVSLLEQAVAADPAFADAWAVLSAAHAISWGYVRNPDIARSTGAARSAAGQALLLNPDSSLAKAVMADTLLLQTPRQWNEGLTRFAEGVVSHPRDSTMRLWYGVNLTAAGYLEEGRIQLLAAYKQDPAAGVNNALLGRAYLMAGDLGRAVGHMHRAMALGYPDAQNFLRLMYFHMGLDERVLETPAMGPAVIPDRWWRALLAARQDAGAAPELLALSGQLVTDTEARAGLLSYPFVINDALASLGLLDSYIDTIGRRIPYDPDQALALWLPWNLALRQSGDFQQLAEALGLMDLWRARGFPDLCQEVDGGLRCQ